jgi:hypothetical protein
MPMKIRTLALLTACLAQPLLADTPSDKDNETKRMREKESARAREAAAGFADKADFTEKYEQLKESEPGLFAEALDKRLLAAKAWQNAAEAFTKIDSSDQIGAVKAPAHDAEEVAEIARMEMRAAAAEKEWKRTAEKYKSRELEQLAGQLIQNQRNIIQATKQRMMGQRQLRQLEIERGHLSTKLRELQDEAREEDADKKNRNSSRDQDKSRDRKPSSDENKERAEAKPVKILVE